MTNEVSKNAATGDTDQQFRYNMSKMTIYMRFIGVLTIIFGALYCIFIITAIVGIPAIFMGVRMREAAANFDKYASTGNLQDLWNAVERQKRFFFIQYVFAIIGLILMVIYIIAIIVMIGSGF